MKSWKRCMPLGPVLAVWLPAVSVAEPLQVAMVEPTGRETRAFGAESALARLPHHRPAPSPRQPLDPGLVPAPRLLLPGEDFTGVIEGSGADPAESCRLSGGRVDWRPGEVVTLALPPDQAVEPLRRRVERLAEAEDSVESLAALANLTPAQVRDLNGWEPDHELEPGERVRLFVPVEHSREGVDEVGKRFRARYEEPTVMPDGSPLYTLKTPAHAWGTRQTVDALVEIAEAHHRAFPDAPGLVIGDISRRWGGRFRPHVSHRYGTDVDMALPLASGEAPWRFVRLNAETLDVPRAWEIVRATLATGQAKYIFVDYRLQKVIRAYAAEVAKVPEALLDEIFQAPYGIGSRSGIVRHERGHRDHFHIRFDPSTPVASDALLAWVRGSESAAAAQRELEARCGAFAANVLWSRIASPEPPEPSEEVEWSGDDDGDGAGGVSAM